jgi:hypothetical protein
MINIVRILKEELGTQAYNVPLRKLPDFLLKLKPYLDPVIKLVVSELGRVRNSGYKPWAHRAGLGATPRGGDHCRGRAQSDQNGNSQGLNCCYRFTNGWDMARLAARFCAPLRSLRDA